MSSILQSKPYKCLLFGEDNSGKTALIMYLKQNKFITKYSPTIGIDVSLITIDTQNGNKYDMSMWDLAGLDQFGGLRDGYYIDADCDIGMFSTDETKMLNYVGEINKVGNVPMALCKSKICNHTDIDPNYINISVATNYNLYKPFEQLLAKLTGDANIVITNIQ